MLKYRKMIDLVFYNNTIDRTWTKNFFKEILQEAEKNESLNLDKSRKYGLSLHLTGEGRIKALNKKYCGKNKITDVLSFPMGDISKKPDVRAIIELGDIFICLPFAKKIAKRQNTSIEKQLAALVIHGFLHLLEFDHEESDKEKQKMFLIQENILNNFKF